MTLPSGQQVEAERLAPPDLALVQRRIREVVRTLENFKQMRGAGRARGEYMEQVGRGGEGEEAGRAGWVGGWAGRVGRAGWVDGQGGWDGYRCSASVVSGWTGAGQRCCAPGLAD